MISSQESSKIVSRKRSLLEIIQVPSYLVISIWVIHLLKITHVFSTGRFGLIPREPSHVIGIFTSPFIHGSFEHLISNSVPLFVLTLMIMFFYKRIAFRTLFLIYVLTGLAVWLFARPVIHIGASGVVYGLVSFIFWLGMFRRNVKSIILALIIVFLYSGLFLGILPNQPGISWESHLFGGVVGIIVAFLMRQYKEDDEHTEDPWADEDDQNDEFFLPRDTFEETLRERAERMRRNEGGDWISDHS